MSIFVLNYFFFGFSMFLISIFILLKRGDEIARRWLYFSILVAIWAVFYAFQVNSNSSDAFALYSARVANGCSSFIPMAWLYFIYAFLEIKNEKFFYVLTLVAMLLLLSAPTQMFIPAIIATVKFNHVSVPGPIFHIQTINFLLIVSFGFFLMGRMYLQEKDRDRKREISSLVIATAFGFIGGGSNYSIIYLKDLGVDLTLLLSSYPFLMAYAMIKHRALDPEKIANAVHREKLAAVGLLAASINHEIKSPLYIIKSQAETLLEGLENGTLHALSATEKDLRIKRALTKTVEQTTRVFEISKRLMDFSKPSTAGNDSSCNLNEALGNVFSFVAYLLSTSQVLLEKVIDPKIVVMGNIQEIEQIFLNLIVNSVQAIEGKAGQVKISVQEQKDLIMVIVQDTGGGMTPMEVKRIFMPFHTTKLTGTGLGLYITKLLVKKNGGKISARSTFGKGATFTIEFKKGLF